MGLYTGADYPVAAEIEALHTSELASFTQCGTWGSAAQRAAIAATAREARSAAGLQEAVSDKRDGDTAKLPDAALQLARDVATARLSTESIAARFKQKALPKALMWRLLGSFPVS
jgi:hypothetical protein